MLGQLLLRLNNRDQALMLRCAMPAGAPRLRRAAWTAITHLGGTGPSLLAASIPWLVCCALENARSALATLVISHVIVQIIKRTVVRDRPAEAGRCVRVIVEPDRFSFPSGHSAAAMSVALGYGAAFPLWAALLLALALLVGFSRVRLGVHYPGDVVAGHFIALATAVLLWAIPGL